MNAILVKELRSYLRGRRPFVMLSVFLGLLSCLLVLVYGSMVSSSFAQRSDIGLTLFASTIGLSLGQLVLIAPSLSASSLGAERDRQTLDLLLITPINSFKIVLGKLVAPCIFLLLMALATLPLAAIGFLVGGIELRDLISAFIIQGTTILGFSTLGIWAASRMQTSRGALLVSQGIGLTIAVFVPVMMLFLIEGLNMDDFVRTDVGGFVAWLILSLSPFVDLAGWAAAVNENTFWTNSAPFGGGDVPAGWLLCLIFWAIMIPLLLMSSARSLRRSAAKNSG